MDDVKINYPVSPENPSHCRGLHRWIIDPPLEITVPAKRTPWPDAPPELPTTEKAEIVQENTIIKHPTKTRSSRSRRSSRKRKHEAKAVVDVAGSAKHNEQN